MAQAVKNVLQCRRPEFNPWVRKISWEQEEGIATHPSISWTSLVAQMVKRLPTVWETQVQSLGLEDPLEKEIAAHSSTLSWKIPWTEEPGGLQSMGSQRVGHN